VMTLFTGERKHGEYNFNLDLYWCTECSSWNKGIHKHFQDVISSHPTTNQDGAGLSSSEEKQPRKHGEYDPHRMGYWCAECNSWALDTHKHFKGLVLPTSNMDIPSAVPEKATSSQIAYRYDLIPPCFLKRVAARFFLGSKQHAEYNWRKGLYNLDFVQARINHLQSHLQDYLQGVNLDDDNLAAIAWGVAMLMEFETHEEGKKTIQAVRERMNFK
jgi:hypothetical protein